MFFFSLALFVAAVVAFASFGLNVGVDFKGGSVLELEFSGGRPTVDEITNVLRSDPTLKDREVNINLLIFQSGVTAQHISNLIHRRPSARKL